MYSTESQLYRDFTTRFKAQFEAAQTWKDYAKAIDLPETWLDSPWAEKYFQTVKTHNSFVGRYLLIPEVMSAENLIESISFEPSKNSWSFYTLRADTLYKTICATLPHINVDENGMFHARGGKGDFKWLHITFKPEIFERLKEYFGYYSCQVIQRGDGTILLTFERSNAIGSDWISLLQPFQATDFMTEAECKEIAAYRAHCDNITSLIGDESAPIDLERAKALGVEVKTRKKPHWM